MDSDPSTNTALATGKGQTWPKVVEVHVRFEDDPADTLLVKPSVSITNMSGKKAEDLVSEIMNDLKWDKPSPQVSSLRKDRIADDLGSTGHSETPAFKKRIDRSVQSLVKDASKNKSNLQLSIDVQADLTEENYISRLHDLEAERQNAKFMRERKDRNVDLTLTLSTDPATQRMIPHLTFSWAREGLDHVSLNTVLDEMQDFLHQRLEECQQINRIQHLVSNAETASRLRLAGVIKESLAKRLSRYDITSEPHSYTLTTHIYCDDNLSDLVYNQWYERRRLASQPGPPPSQQSSDVQSITDTFASTTLARRH